MEYIELDFLGTAKEIDPNFIKLFERITGHNLIKFKNFRITNLTMTTYLFCKNCNQKFKSPIQVKNIENPILDWDKFTFSGPFFLNNSNINAVSAH